MCPLDSELPQQTWRVLTDWESAGSDQFTCMLLEIFARAPLSHPSPLHTGVLEAMGSAAHASQLPCSAFLMAQGQVQCCATHTPPQLPCKPASLCVCVRAEQSPPISKLCASQQLGMGWAELCPFFSPLLLSLQPLYSLPCPKLSLEPETATRARRPGPICSRCLMNSQLLGGGIVPEVIQPCHYGSICFPFSAFLLLKAFEPLSLIEHLLCACWAELGGQLKKMQESG